ncbi:hypothetical protein [Kitasatospora sp. NPDC050543]|uniref:hypothetical protein n=1 Tax=Kitasatospora sp. NPDC050543 TaxID=3364054 RepID=UPI0037AB2F89
MQQLATRRLIATSVVYLTGPMETAADRQYLAWVAQQLHVPIADREVRWLWGTDGLLVVAGWEDSIDARHDVDVATKSDLIVHCLTDHRATGTPPIERSA